MAPEWKEVRTPKFSSQAAFRPFTPLPFGWAAVAPATAAVASFPPSLPGPLPYSPLLYLVFSLSLSLFPPLFLFSPFMVFYIRIRGTRALKGVRASSLLVVFMDSGYERSLVAN